MTSANVFYYDFKSPDGSLLHRERVHVLTKKTYDVEKIKQLPENTKVVCWGYDEEEDEWEEKPVKITKWLDRMKQYCLKID